MPSRSTLRLLLLAIFALGGTAALLFSGASPFAVLGLLGLTLVLAGIEIALAYRKPVWLPAVRHAAELWVSANPDYILDDVRVPPALREVLTLLAGHANRPQTELRAAVDHATTALQQDGVLLRGLIESMDDAVIACTVDGRVLLYNAAAARRFASDSGLALGRSIFTIFRRWALSHFVARLVNNSRRVGGVLTTRAGQSYHARLAALDLDGRKGILLSVQPLAEFASSRSEVAELLQPRRAKFANLLAALETLQDHGDLSADDQARLLGVASNETRALVDSFRDLSQRLQESSAAPRDDVAARDLVPILADRLGLKVPDAGEGTPSSFWLRAESASLARVVESLGHWLREQGAEPLAVETRPDVGYACVVIRWAGGSVQAEALNTWQQAPMEDEAESAGGHDLASPQSLLEWQGGALWAEAGSESGALTLLLELAEEPEAEGFVDAMPPTRPEYFDFALFDAPNNGWDESLPLNRLALTVFDTETTGLSPREGDEIISIGAIRVLNGRLLGQEVFETLVRSQHPIHPESQRIHGIDAAMLQGAPSQTDALRRFQAFCGDNLLLGHNVAFDLRFLQIAAQKHGLQQPAQALDTLLLSSVVYPEREQHRLEDIAQRLGIAVLGRHTSLGDALLTAEVFCRLIPLLEHKGICTLGQALAASRESWYARLDY